MNVDKLLAGPFNLEEFRAAIKEFHPDRAGNDEIYKKLVAWRDSFEPTMVYIRGLNKTFELGQPIYQGHSSRIFKVTHKELLKKVPAGQNAYIKIIKDKRLNNFVVNEYYAISSGLKCFPSAIMSDIYLGKDCDMFSAPRGYMYSTFPCFTIKEIKDKVNEIKRRQKFRPFAPVILEERADMYFDMPRGFSDSRYMQVIARCRHPHIFPAIVHADGTSRVQTVPKDGSGIRELLEKWYVLTGCPMLLNTSLNIRGEPMVNDRKDADRFELMYNVKVIS